VIIPRIGAAKSKQAVGECFIAIWGEKNCCALVQELYDVSSRDADAGNPMEMGFFLPVIDSCGGGGGSLVECDTMHLEISTRVVVFVTGIRRFPVGLWPQRASRYLILSIILPLQNPLIPSTSIHIPFD
jgi:hypothetical protein